MARDYRLRNTVGITLADYERMFAVQGGRCAVCQETDTRSQYNVFCVDHDHSTGEVRALLCNHCNRSLGLMQDDPERLEAAARYIRLHRDQSC